MAFRLDHSLPAAESALCRARTEVRKACTIAPSETEIANGFHCVRRRLKRARSLTRLITAGMPKREGKKIDRDLRDIGRSLAPQRDAASVQTTWTVLANHYQSSKAMHTRIARLLQAGVFEPCRNTDVDDGHLKDPQLHQQPQLLDRLDALHKRLEAVELRDDGFQAICPALEQTFSRAHQRMTRALRSQQAEDFHDWRKDAQRHARHLQFFSNCWPATLTPLTLEAKLLARMLGWDHDLAVMSQHLPPADSRRFRQRDAEWVTRAVADAQFQARLMATQLGPRVFAGKPDAFAAWLGDIWAAGQLHATPSTHLSPTNLPSAILPEVSKSQTRSLAIEPIAVRSRLPSD